MRLAKGKPTSGEADDAAEGIVIMDVPSPQSWQETAAWAALVSSVTGVITWITGRRAQRTTVTRDAAETERAKADTEHLRNETERIRNDSAKEFESAVNERVRLVFEQQNELIAAQNVQIARLTDEVHALRGEVARLTEQLDKEKRARSGAGQGG